MSASLEISSTTGLHLAHDAALFHAKVLKVREHKFERGVIDLHTYVLASCYLVGSNMSQLRQLRYIPSG